MKARNKLMALLLALVMVLGLAGTALADGTEDCTDISGHWAEEEIGQALELGLMDAQDGKFAPNEPITRADLVEALYRLAGKPAAGDVNPFTDVAEDAAYRDAVVWASAQGIVNGKTPDTFDPDGDAKRQEIAKILNLFAASQVGQESLSTKNEKVSAYADASDVSSWAVDYMNWAAASEFITGNAGKLDPKGTATRAQIAAILCRYMEDASTGDASKDDPRNQDGIGEKELLVISFGTSYNDSRVATIGAIEGALEEAFSDYAVRRGFTADIIIDHVLRRDGEAIDNVTEALERAKANGVKDLLVQPTHLMNGWEYGDLVKELEGCAADFETIKIGDPLLTTDEDYAAVAEAMVAATAGFDDGETAICFMGHGTEAASNGVYDKMQGVLTEAGHEHYFVGTVEAHPDVEDVLAMVQAGDYKRVVLRPMMIVAGDHANNDMAGNDEDAWKSVFEAAGYEVICEIKGLGELEGIQQLLVSHAQNAKPLGETGIEVEPNPENGGDEAEATGLADGVYTIEVSCEGMFRVVKCELTVSGGEMTAIMTLSGTGYDKMFVGTAAQAEAATEGFITFVEDAEGAYTFTVPVEALDEGLAYAAYGTKGAKWYDRELTFESATAVAK